MRRMEVRRATAEELLAMPDDGRRWELVRGELRSMSPAGSEHGAVAIRLGALLAAHILQRRLGVPFGAETGFTLARKPDTVRAPDFAFVRAERVPHRLPRGYFPGAPDLAVEVVSPGDTAAEVEEKAHCWLAHGTVLVWVVSPAKQTVTAYRAADVRVLHAADDLTADDLLPGFRCAVGDLFDR